MYITFILGVDFDPPKRKEIVEVMRIIDLADIEADIDKFYNTDLPDGDLLQRLMNIELVEGETLELKCADDNISGVYDVIRVSHDDEELYCKQCAMYSGEKTIKYCFAFNCSSSDDSNLTLKRVDNGKENSENKLSPD
jgi:hypothetical protein